MVKSKDTKEKREILRGGKTKFDKKIRESSRRYLLRQAKDPFNKQAEKEGYRSRAVYKLQEIDDKHKFINPGMNVADLGAAPGGWCQLLSQRMQNEGTIVAVDLIKIDPIVGVDFIQGDFTSDEVYEQLLQKCPNGLDLVVSDMAPNTSGQSSLDHIRSMMLAEMALDFAYTTLKPNGNFVCKVFMGGEEVEMRNEMRKTFDKVLFEKPASSRSDSKEIFIVGIGYKG